MRVTLKTEYALRSPAALARHAPDLVKAETQADTPSSSSLTRLWVGLSSSIESVLDDTTIADVVAGRLPEHVESLARRPSRVDR